MADIALRAGRINLAEFNYRLFVANAEAGHTIEDVLKPGYWAHCARQFTTMDEIIIRAEDGSFRLHLFVTKCTPTSADVRLIGEPLLMMAGLDPKIPVGDGAVYVQWRGPHDKFCVFRAEDGERIFKGQQTRDAAELAAKEHLKVTAPRPRAAQ
jgi:hypothetical protein